MITYNTAEQVYSRNHGSERLFKRPYCQTLNYTEGIFDFQKSMNAFWVVDNMVSYMPQILKAFEQNEYEFFVVEICVNKENKGHMEVFTEEYVKISCDGEYAFPEFISMWNSFIKQYEIEEVTDTQEVKQVA